VETLIDLGLEFAEIPIENIGIFKHNFSKYLAFLEGNRFYFLCHGPKEGDPNDIASLRETYAPYLVEILQLMPTLGMSLLTVHLWLDRRFVKPDVLDFKVDILHDNLGGPSPADDLHLPPGKGTVDFPAIFEGLRKAGYKGTATLELAPDEIKSCIGFIRTLSS